MGVYPLRTAIVPLNSHAKVRRIDLSHAYKLANTIPVIYGIDLSHAYKLANTIPVIYGILKSSVPLNSRRKVYALELLDDIFLSLEFMI